MSFLMFGVLQLGKHAADKIKRGELNTNLIRPTNTKVMLVGEHIGERIHGYSWSWTRPGHKSTGCQHKFLFD